MSGTSIDGIDAVAMSWDASGQLLPLTATLHQPYAPGLRQQLLEASVGLMPLTASEWTALDADVGDAFADAAATLIERFRLSVADITAIGSHGQTVFHDGTRGITMQIGDPNRIVARTGIDTVSDFRRLDLALGGQGAPLVPGFHGAVFGSSDENRCVINLGGIANITRIPRSRSGPITGFDTGPANTLLDEWAQRTLNMPCDVDGRLAAGGTPRPDLVEALLGDPYFRRMPPKSTGRDHFNLAWAERRYPKIGQIDHSDVQASFVEVTARSVCEAVMQAGQAADRLIVCGGGSRNPVLMRALSAAFAPIPVDCSDAHGMPAAWVEAAAFAWLARQRHRGRSGNLVSVTGASGPACLGSWIRARPGDEAG